MNEFERNNQLIDAGFTVSEIVSKYQHDNYEDWYETRYGWREHRYIHGSREVYATVQAYFDDNFSLGAYINSSVALTVSTLVFNGYSTMSSAAWGTTQELVDRFTAYQ